MIRPFGDNVLVLMDREEVSQGGILLVEARPKKYGAKRPNSAGVGGDCWWGTVLDAGPKVSEVAKGDRVLTWWLAGEPIEPEQLSRLGHEELVGRDVRLIRVEAIELVREASAGSPPTSDTPPPLDEPAPDTLPARSEAAQ